MQKILSLITLTGFLLTAGCSDNKKTPPVDPAVKAKENSKMFRCRNCRQKVENSRIKRVSQTRGTCPRCGKTGVMIPVK
jgi:transcription elongation factor Elf1